MSGESLPWLVFPPAVDLANTVIASPGGAVDLLETDAQLERWIAAERGRIADVGSASRRLGEVRALRDDVLALLRARASGARLPAGPRRRINSLSASAPLSTTLTPAGRAVEELASRDPFVRFSAAVARSAVELVARDDDRLSLCGAPSCGMLFLRDHPRQVWCTKECGNRARVARHAARARSGPGRVRGR